MKGVWPEGMFSVTVTRPELKVTFAIVKADEPCVTSTPWIKTLAAGR